MLKWSNPTSITELKGFLGLTRYYRKFIIHYGILARPLTNFLCKQQFQWSPLADQDFLQLKTTMTNAPVLAIPDFGLQFIRNIHLWGGHWCSLTWKGSAYCFSEQSIRTKTPRILHLWKRVPCSYFGSGELATIPTTSRVFDSNIPSQPFLLDWTNSTLSYVEEGNDWTYGPPVLSGLSQREWKYGCGCFIPSGALDERHNSVWSPTSVGIRNS